MFCIQQPQNNILLVSEIPACISSACDVLSHFSHVQLFGTLLWVLCLWDSPDKNTGVGCHAPLQRIFPTRGIEPSSLHLLHCQEGSSSLASPGKTLYLETHTITKLFILINTLVNDISISRYLFDN